MNLVKPGTKIDFVGKRKYAAVASVLMVLVSITLFFVKKPNWGIDFTGGTELHLEFTDPVEIGEVRSALSQLDLSNDAVQGVGGPDEHEFLVRIQDPTFGTGGIQTEVQEVLEGEFGAGWIAESAFDAQVGARLQIRYTGNPVPISKIQQVVKPLDGASARDALDDNTIYVDLPGLSSRIEDTLRGTLGERDFRVLKVDSVGSKVGGELRRQGFIAIMATLVLILVYVGFRFDLAFAPGAVIALFHDVTIVVGIFVIIGHEFNLPMIGALLTIIGYSLNDTIVIYDRIRENMQKYRRRDIANLINGSINETLARTIATSLTTMLAMAAFLVLGGPVIEDFALAIMLGVIFGTYSTVFVASPTILVMQDLRPTLAKLVAPMAAARSEEGEDAPQTAAARRREERKALRNSAGPELGG